MDVFRWMAWEIFSTVTFQDDSPDIKDACAGCVHHALIYFMLWVEKDPQSGGVLLAMGGYPSPSPSPSYPSHSPFPSPSSQSGLLLGSVLTLLAQVYRVDLSIAAVCRPLNALMHHAAERQPEAATFVPLLDLYTSLATEARGATHIFAKVRERERERERKRERVCVCLSVCVCLCLCV